MRFGSIQVGTIHKHSRRYALHTIDATMELLKIAEESAKGGFALMVGTTLSTVGGAITSILIARLLGASGYGVYSLSFVIPFLFVSAADFGVSPALTKYTASLRSQKRDFRVASMISSAFFLTLATSSVAFLLAYGSAGQLAAFC